MILSKINDLKYVNYASKKKQNIVNYSFKNASKIQSLTLLTIKSWITLLFNKVSSICRSLVFTIVKCSIGKNAVNTAFFILIFSNLKTCLQ